MRCSACEADRRIEDFAAASSGWFWEMDAECRFSYFSKSVESVTGVPPEWHYGKSREDIGIPDSVTPRAWADHLEALRERRPFENFVFRRKGPDGLKWMQTSGIPIFDDAGVFAGYRGVATDITDRMAAERRVQLLVAAIENLSEMFALWDADGKMVVCNERFREINRAVIEKIQPGCIFDDYIRAGVCAGLFPAAVGRESTWIDERLQRHRDPREPFEVQRQAGLWVLVNEHRLRDGCIATIATDVTRLKRSELELAAHKQHLEMLVDERTEELKSANEELKQFTYVVSHDLRAPSISISCFVSELVRDTQRIRTIVDPVVDSVAEHERDELRTLLTDDVPAALEFIVASASRIKRQIDALLEYSQLGRREIKAEPLDLEHIVAGCVSSLKHRLECKDIALRVDPLPSLVSDAFSLEVIISNLLENAIKYLQPDRPGLIHVRGRREQSIVRLEVIDNGRGIAAQDLERIFQVFFRAASAGIDGVGIGLSAVQASVRRLGGKVWCESVPDRGTRFVVELPVTVTGS